MIVRENERPRIKEREWGELKGGFSSGEGELRRRRIRRRRKKRRRRSRFSQFHGLRKKTFSVFRSVKKKQKGQKEKKRMEKTGRQQNRIIGASQIREEIA